MYSATAAYGFPGILRNTHGKLHRYAYNNVSFFFSFHKLCYNIFCLSHTGCYSFIRTNFTQDFVSASGIDDQFYVLRNFSKC